MDKIAQRCQQDQHNNLPEGFFSVEAFDLFHQSNSLRNGRVDSTDEITSANFSQIQQLSSQNWIGYVCFSITVQTNRFAMGKLADRYSKEQEQLVHQIIAYRRSGLNFKQIADKLNELNITTINGNSFQNKHVHMMLKRYHQRQFRLNLMKTEYE